MEEYELTTNVDMGIIQKAVYQNSADHGFWDTEPNVPEKLALIHSEVSEALEDYRTGNMEVHYREEDGKPEGFGSELADIVIRVMDLCQYLRINLAEEVIIKHEYNKSRPYMHDKIC